MLTWEGVFVDYNSPGLFLGTTRHEIAEIARTASAFVPLRTHAQLARRGLPVPVVVLPTKRTKQFMEPVRTRWRWRLLLHRSSPRYTARWRCRSHTPGRRSQTYNWGRRLHCPAQTTSWQFPAGMVLGRPILVHSEHRDMHYLLRRRGDRGDERGACTEVLHLKVGWAIGRERYHYAPPRHASSATNRGLPYCTGAILMCGDCEQRTIIFMGDWEPIAPSGQ